MSLKNNHYRYNSRRLTKTKLLVLGALLFSLGVGTSVTATYAWYSLREFAAVNNLNLQIDALSEKAYLKLYLDKDGEQIHKEDGYTKEDLGIKDKDGKDRELTDVSGMFQDKWLNDETDMSNAVPELRTSYRTAFGINVTDPGVANTNEETGKDFYVQNVFYLEAGMDCHIYLAEDSDISANQEQNEIVARTKGKSLDKLNQVAHTVRTSFFTDEGYVVAQPDENDYETYYGGILDLNKDGSYDNRDDKEILYGEYSGEVPYRSEPKSYDPVDEKDITTFVSNHKDGVTQVDLDNKDFIKKENAKRIKDITYINIDSHKEEYDSGARSLAQDVILNKNAEPLCSVHKGEKKRIVVSVYVEGWDRYMTDDIASACFDINISFTALFDI